jgi:lipopolysaccharide transport system permease protein
MIMNLWRHRQLVLSLTRRTYQLRYRQSMAGFVWAIVPPLMTVGAATIVFGTVVGVNTGRTPYAIFAFAALIPWSFLASSLTSAVPSIVQAQQMVSRFAFPRAALPLSMVGLALIDFAVAGVAFVGFAYLTGQGIPITALWFPLVFLVEVVLVTGVVMLASALNVFTRDVKLATAFRRILVHGVPPDLGQLLPAIIGSIVLLTVGTWYFASTEWRFADVI